MIRRRAYRALALVVGVIAVLVALPAIIPGLDLNPFKTETEDRSQPVILKSLERLTEYRAASANLQVPVDVREDVGILPDFIAGKKTLIIASGTVDASVDFRGLRRGRNLVVSKDRKSVTITLPAARLSDARVDLSKTRVFDTNRGLINRVGEAFGDGGADEERKLLELAQRKLAEAAKAEPELLRNAEDNTRAMLEGLMRGLGFTRVTVNFAPPAT